MTVELLKKKYLEKYNQAHQLHNRFPSDPAMKERYYLLKSIVGDLEALPNTEKKYNNLEVGKNNQRKEKLGEPVINNGASLQKMYDNYSGKDPDEKSKVEDIEADTIIKTILPKKREACNCPKAWQKGYQCTTCPGKHLLKY